jgi:hypothetical protein
MPSELRRLRPTARAKHGWSRPRRRVCPAVAEDPEYLIVGRVGMGGYVRWFSLGWGISRPPAREEVVSFVPGATVFQS